MTVSRLRYFVLDGHEVRHVEDAADWANFHHSDKRVVKQDNIGTDVRVSTVFIGLGTVFFETMIFGGPHHEWQTRCNTWDEAEATHARAVTLAEEGEVFKRRHWTTK